MGMDLKPINPSSNAPRYPTDHDYAPNKIIQGRYNWTGWDRLTQLLEVWGINTEEFVAYNGGDIITADKCKKVADAIDAHYDELTDKEKAWIKGHSDLWRTCGGYEQW